MGPTALGRIIKFRRLLFPNYNFYVIETMAHVALVFFRFLVGLQMDIKSVLRIGIKARNVAVIGIIVPFVMGTILYFSLTRDEEARGYVVTGSTANIHWGIICTIAYALFCVFYLHRAIGWIIRKMPEGQGYSEFFICTILSGMAISGTVTNALGTHPIIGAFLFVLSIPNQMLQAEILDKLDDFVMDILMPTLFSVAATFFSDMSIKEALAVGVLSNTKRLMALIIIEAGQAQQIRVLACIYGTHGIPSVINLLALSNSTPASPITVFALQVVELVGRASSMLEVHNSGKRGSRSLGQEETQTRQIITAFDNYELRSDGVMVQVLTARSALSAMDEDICNIAKDKGVAFIILPFHKQRSLEGEMEDVNPEIRAVNEGADDREALAYASRMVDRPDTRLTVVKFIPDEGATDVDAVEFADDSHVNVQIDKESEKLMDEEFLNRFKISTANDKSVKYIELLLNDVEEAAKAIKLMDQHNYDLYIVGKGRGMVSPLTAGLVDWCDCPELGAIGDLLVTSEFDSTFSVLVMQQYVKPIGDGSVNSYGSMSERIEGIGMDMDLDMQRADSEAVDVFSSFRRRPEPMPRV
ncbi:hypothetical protein RND71_035458 [Anisodus tanguticus]|uniref:Cation/H(+) antiporter C-terminal domain-containing protein n=1 Tax=Anisodus tanguticus TaxID=243964 RepID=A0AAE1R737_9SOLA|nr:hypothetical protein RND71_035458 [Anisodus tanguticus]